MSAEQRLTYVDSSAIVKLAVAEPESPALRRYLLRRERGPDDPANRLGEQVLRRIQLLRLNDRVLSEAGRMLPAELRSLDAIHLASARELGSSVRQIITYDGRMADAARDHGWTVASPA